MNRLRRRTPTTERLLQEAKIFTGLMRLLPLPLLPSNPQRSRAQAPPTPSSPARRSHQMLRQKESSPDHVVLDYLTVVWPPQPHWRKFGDGAREHHACGATGWVGAGRSTVTVNVRHSAHSYGGPALGICMDSYSYVKYESPVSRVKPNFRLLSFYRCIRP